MTDKEQFIAALKATGRAGIDKVIAGLEELGFFTAPASSWHHGSVPGGLLTHSLNVFTEAKVVAESQIKLRPELAEKLPDASIAIAALLHDVCKAEIYKEALRWRKDENNRWEQYKTYAIDDTSFPVGHGEKSVIRLLRWGLELTDDEIFAIRWHMTAFDIPSGGGGMANYNAAIDNCPLLVVLIAADSLASKLLENK